MIFNYTYYRKRTLLIKNNQMILEVNIRILEITGSKNKNYFIHYFLF